MTYRTVIWRALAAGAVAGVLLAGYILLVTEPAIEDAIALEEQRAHEDAEDGQDGEAHEDAMFTRSEQVGGGAAAGFAYAIVAAVIFGTVFAALRHRLPGSSDLGRSAWLAAVAFGAVVVIPALKYPPNPPAVGDPDTVGYRSALYLAIIVSSLVLVSLLTRLSGLLRHRLDDARRTVVVAALAIVAFGLVLVAFPPNPDSIDPAVPAALVWDFRIRSIGGLALLWVVLGLGLGALVHREVPGRDVDEAVSVARA